MLAELAACRPQGVVLMGGWSAVVLARFKPISLHRDHGRLLDVQLPDGSTLPAVLTFGPDFLQRCADDIKRLEYRRQCWQALLSLMGAMGWR
jgi:hypothetical protein